MISPADELLLRRALRVAMNGRGRVEPNPMVGCVLVRDGTVLGEGWHGHFGGPHAEPTALADCQARGSDPRGATAYVTLEPCCHTNKKTPPCVPRLIEAGIARVVIGCLDPNPDVDGNGVVMLRQAGIVVETAPPMLASEFLQLIAPFRLTRNYVTLKWARSANGCVAGEHGHPVRITNAQSTAAVHRLRTRCHGIAVGVNTVLSDDPLLTVRGVDVIHRPRRIILDRHLRTPPAARRLTDRDGPPVCIVCDEAAKQKFPDRYERLSRWAEIRATLPSAAAMDALAAGMGVANRHVLVEPGPTLGASLLPAADRLWVFTSDADLPAGPDVPRAPAVPPAYVETGRLRFGTDTLVEYLNTAAASFVTAMPSADFVLEADLTAASG